MKRDFFIKLSYLVIVIWLLVIPTGCAQSVRYSPDEIRDYPPAMQEHIKLGEVVTGMTTQQVRYAWGSPMAINILQPSEEGKYREEWVYTRVGVFKTRLIFIDGKLTHIITNEPGVIKD